MNPFKAERIAAESMLALWHDGEAPERERTAEEWRAVAEGAVRLAVDMVEGFVELAAKVRQEVECVDVERFLEAHLEMSQEAEAKGSP